VYAFLVVNWAELVNVKDLFPLLTIGYLITTGLLIYTSYLNIYNLCFKHKYNRVSQLAENDPLSGLMSRSAGMNFLRKSFNHAKITGERLTIAFVDVNDLKVVNDKHGHHAGDHLIEKISEVIRSSIRDTDGAMRFGGDEFILILPDCPQYRAEEVMTQINVYLNRFNLSGEFGYKVGVSHGLVEYNALRHNSALDLIAEADTEMYKNKKKNKRSNI
jgi:diguanylate cyclase (GGDEF)-like protein